MAPWTLRNYVVLGKAVLVTTVGGEVFWLSNNPVAYADPAFRGRNIEATALPDWQDFSTKSEVELQEKIDKNLVGGFILRVGDKQVDASILRQLKNLDRNFSENPYIREY